MTSLRSVTPFQNSLELRPSLLHQDKWSNHNHHNSEQHMSQYGTSHNLQSRPMLSPTMMSTRGLPPPRPSSQASTDSDRSKTLASVHSILNHADDEEPPSKRRNAAQMEIDGMSPTLPSLNTRPPSSGGSGSGGGSGVGSGNGGVSSSGLNGFTDKSPMGYQISSKSGSGPRRILTPISPTLNRAASMNRVVGTIDAQSTPFLGNSSDVSRPQSSEPASAGLPLTLPPFSSGNNSQRQSFSHSHVSVPSLQSIPRRKSVSVLPSARASPSPSYSSYSHSGQASPSLPPFPPSTGPTPYGSLSLAASPVIGPTRPISPASVDTEGNSLHGIPMVASGQTSYEYFTIPSGRGLVQLPVEVSIASRQADEKRKRNAGASARFRQRRKEKEREANTTIDRLRDDLRLAHEDCEYYARERDMLLDTLKKFPGWEHHVPQQRSPSPRSKRRAQSIQTSSGSGVASGAVSPTSPLPPPKELHHPSHDTERNTRRRLDNDTYQPLSSPQEPPPSYHQQYPPYSPRHVPPQLSQIPMVESNRPWTKQH